MMLEAGVGTPDEIARVKEESKGSGCSSVRSSGWTGRRPNRRWGSASRATATANQIEFINMIVDYLTENGVMEP